MPETSTIFGAEEVLANMRKANKYLGVAAERGMLKAGRLLQRFSQQIVPIDTGDLKGSAGTRKTGSGWYTIVTVFYTKSYAVYVHENTRARHAPGKRAKYLEGPAREHKNMLLKIIAGTIDVHMHGKALGPSLPPGYQPPATEWWQTGAYGPGMVT